MRNAKRKMKNADRHAPTFAFCILHFAFFNSPSLPQPFPSGEGRRRGFTLIELLAVVALIGVFTVLSASLFRSTLRWATAAQRQSATGGALRQAVDRLRADVWNSYEVNVGDERTVLLRQAGDRTAVWLIGHDAVSGVRRIRREVWRRPPTAEAEVLEQTDWPLGEVEAGFERSAAGLTIWRATGEGDAADGPAGRRATRLMSQLLIEAEAGG